MNYTKGKVVFVGDAGVGKTSIIYKYLRNNTPVSPTVAGNSMPIEVQLENGNVVKLNVWDTSGSENYQCLVPMFARTSQVAIIVFDVTEEETFDNVEEWLKYLNTNSNTPNIFLVGNKIDCENSFPNCNSRADEYASEKKLTLFFTSAKNGQNLDLLFQEIGTIVDNATVEQTPKPVVFKPDDGNNNTNNNNSCC